MSENNLPSQLSKREKYLYPTKVPYYQNPLQLLRSEGCRVWDSEGRDYLDAIGGIVSISVGHNHPRIVSKMRSMVEEGAIQHTSFLYLNLYMEELAEKLSELFPGGDAKAYFTNSGSEANEMAILTARVSTGEEMVVALRHGYHGGTHVPLSLCGHNTWKFPHQGPSNVVHAVEPNCYRCPFGKSKDSCNLECAEDIKNVIETTTHGKVAAFICEPILGVGGFIDPPVEYHKRAKEIVHSFGGKYISDEVQAGVGRTGKNFFAIEDSGVEPDLITMAKGLGNGAPIGVCLSKPENTDNLKGKLHFNTFGGDPYQAMQAVEVIDIVKEENLIENSRQRGEELKRAFLDMKRKFPRLGDVRGRGLMIGLEMVENPETTKDPNPKLTGEVLEKARENGLLLGKGGLWGNVIRIAPPMNLTQQEAGELILIMDQVFEELS